MVDVNDLRRRHHQGSKDTRASELDVNPDQAGPSDWQERRARLVEQALEDEDLEALRKISALPGGFGTDSLRQKAWITLLRTEHFFDEDDAWSTNHAVDKEGSGTNDSINSAIVDSVDPDFRHPDEGQVLLDTKRSFVSYPTDIPQESKETMQSELHTLIVHVLRKYPALSYFQGFHDVMSVLYLTFIPLPPPPKPRSRSQSRRRNAETSRDASQTRLTAHSENSSTHATPASTPRSRSPLPPKTETSTRSSSPSRGIREARDVTQLPGWAPLCQCAEIISLCRVRDAMGKSMDPMMGLLKILKRLLKVADPQLYRFSSLISPVPTLPFFALSWILCLFSHDIDTLEPVQRMFDFLLARNPISAIYLSVAILMSKKKQMLQLAKALGPEAREDPSLLHPLFSRLPPLFADTPDAPIAEDHVNDNKGKAIESKDENPYDPLPLSQIFSLTDDLLARYPWDGPDIRGHEIMGVNSVTRTYETEADPEFSLSTAQEMVDIDVVLPGATEPDEEEEEVVLPVRKRLRLKKLNTTIAVAVVVLGIGMAYYSSGRGGKVAMWGVTAKSILVRRYRENLTSLSQITVFLRQTLRELM